MQKFLQYTLVEKIAQGGMGAVYKCVEDDSKRIVAIKFLLPKVKEVISAKRFLREAKNLAVFQHPNIVKIYNAGEHNGNLFIVMEFVEGVSLDKSELINKSLAEKVMVIKKIATALHYAHQHKIIHRDIKPQNILLDKNARPVVVDFGLAKNIDVDSKALTKTGDVLGTAHYMSPEQVNGEKINEQTDIYALGAVMFELMYGVKMVPGDSNIEVLLNSLKLKRNVVDRRKVPKDLHLVCVKATSTKSLRYKDMSDFIQDLDDFSHQGRAKGLRNFKIIMSLKKMIPVFITTVLLLLAINLWPRNASSSVRLTTVNDYIVSIENSLQNRNYLEVQQLLSRAQNNINSNGEKLQPLEARMLLGQKEYKVFQQKYKTLEVTRDSRYAVAVAEMYCQQGHYSKVTEIIHLLPQNDLQQKYLTGISIKDMKHYLMGVVMFYNNDYHRAHQEFSVITNDSFLRWYPALYYFVGTIYLKENKLAKAFTHLQLAYHREKNKQTLYAMSQCTIKIVSATKDLNKDQQLQVQQCITALYNAIKVEPRISKLHFYLGVIKYHRNEDAFSELMRAIELGERVQVFDTLINLCEKDFLRYELLVRIFRYLFRHYERLERPNIFAQDIRHIQQKYEQSYYRNQFALSNYNSKNIDLLAKAPKVTQQTILDSLPISQDILREVKKKYPQLHQEFHQQIYEKKFTQLFYYYLAHLYFVDNLQMQNEVKNHIEKVWEIAKNDRENSVIRYLAMRMLLKICAYETLQHQAKSIDDPRGKTIYSLLLFRHGLIKISTSQVNKIWKICQGDFLQKLMWDSFIERYDARLMSFTPKTFAFSMFGTLKASYVYLLTKDSAALQHLKHTAKKSESSESIMYAFFAILQKANIENSNDQQWYLFGLQHKSLKQMTLKSIVYQLERMPLPQNSMIAKENVGGIFAQDSFKKIVYGIMCDKQDFTSESLAARIWSKLSTVQDHEILSFLNNDNVSIVKRTMTYFYILESHPGIFINYFFKTLEVVGKLQVPELIKTFGLLPENTPINIVYLLQELKNDTLKLLLYRQMQDAFILGNFGVLYQQSFKSKLYKEFISSHIIRPLDEVIYDFHVQAVCEHMRERPIPFLQDYFQRICDQRPLLHDREVAYRKELRKILQALIIKYFKNKQDINAYFIGLTIYTAQEKYPTLYESSRNLQPEYRKQVAIGFYIRARNALHELETKKMRKVFIEKSRLDRRFPFRSENVHEDRYGKYIEFLREQPQDILKVISSYLDYARNLDPQEMYLYERAVIYRANSEHDKALQLLDILTKNATPRYLLEKMEIRIEQNTLDDKLKDALVTLEKQTTNRTTFKRIAQIYSHFDRNKSCQIYKQLFVQDPYDISCLQEIVRLCPQAQRQDWTLALSVIQEKIKRQKLPIK